MATPAKAEGFLSRLLPPGVIEKVRNRMLFSPSDPHNLHQTPDARFTLPGVDRIKGYRYPAPGSRGPVNVPDGPPELTYSIAYLGRNNYRAKRGALSYTPKKYKKLGITSDLQLATMPDGKPVKEASPGNKNPAVMRYDPTGLRSAMSATIAAQEASIAAHLPTHLVHYEWEVRATELAEKLAAHDLPPQPGYGWQYKAPKALRVAQW